MSWIYKFTAALVLFTFVAVALSILTECKSELLLGVFVLIPVTWTLWIACVVSHKEKTGIGKLVLLWALIDLVVLLYSRWAFGSFHGVDPKGGAEIAWLIEFSPMILPMILLTFIPTIGTGLSAIAAGASSISLPAGSVGVLNDGMDSPAFLRDITRTGSHWVWGSDFNVRSPSHHLTGKLSQFIYMNVLWLCK